MGVRGRSARAAALLMVVALLTTSPTLATARAPSPPAADGLADARGRTIVAADGSDSLVPQPMAVDRLGGSDRVETAAVIAAALPGTASPAAVLARSDDYADALAGVGLAHALGAPLLLTDPTALEPSTAQALERHVAPGATVHVLGGTAALGPDVAASLRSQGFVVRRHAGENRYATAAAVATAQLQAMDKDGGGSAVVASGTSFADALTASVPAARGGWPVLLTPPGDLHPATRDFLRGHGIHGIEVVGGSAAVSPAVVTDLSRIAPARRTAGDDRYATAVAVAERFMDGDDGPPGDGAGVALASGASFADALAGAVLAAARATPLLLTRQRLPESAAQYLAAAEPSEVTVFGGPAAVAPRAVDDAQRAVAQVDPATVRWTPSPGSRLQATTDGAVPPVRLRVPAATLLDTSDAALTIDAERADADVLIDADTLTLTPSADVMAAIPAGTDVTARVQAVLRTTGGAVTYVDDDIVLEVVQPLVTTPEGFRAPAGSGPVIGDDGTLRTYSLEVEPATGVDTRAFADLGEQLLSDPRGWTAGNWRLQRVAPRDADIRVVLALPATVDALCARAGLRTGGIFSCWNNEFAAINLMRWNDGATAFDAPLASYRGYVLNHEVGHGLGYGHRGCPVAAAPAPVMMQQTKTTGACTPNAWPFP